MEPVIGIDVRLTMSSEYSQDIPASLTDCMPSELHQFHKIVKEVWPPMSHFATAKNTSRLAVPS